MRKAVRIARELCGGRADVIGAEVGIGLGENAINMLTEWPGLKMLYLVDPFEKATQISPAAVQFKENTTVILNALYGDRQTRRRVNWQTFCSLEAAKMHKDSSLDFVYIDGDHTFEAVLADIQAWYPKVKSGGVLGGHDYSPLEGGVRSGVDEYEKISGISVSKEMLLTPNAHPEQEIDWWIVK